jgi:uncharacterized metal-binding protein YceD (DUF177 family)
VVKIAVDGLPATGRVVAFGLGDPWAVEAATVSLDRPPERLAGSVSLKRASQSGVVVVDVVAQAAAPASCDRCGEPCELRVEVDTRLLFAPEQGAGAAFDGIAIDDPTGRDIDVVVPGPVQRDGEGIELRAEQLDVGWYKHGEIVLPDVLCEALSLEAPTRIVCADVPACDRRTDALLAARPTMGGPFAALAGFRPAVSASGSADNGRASQPSRGKRRGDAGEED